MATVTDACADEVRTRTETYLEQVRTCTAHLPDAVDAYGTDPKAFAASVDRLNTRESECDATLRELRGLVGESLPPNYTDVYLRADDVVRLYAHLDAVPNNAEQFVRELETMQPALTGEVRSHVREMAGLVVEGTVLLTDATEVYVESLLTGDGVRVTDDVNTIVALEDACDAHKYEALEGAFTADHDDALVVRELLLSLDAAMDAVEDGAEHLLSMASTTL